MKPNLQQLKRDVAIAENQKALAGLFEAFKKDVTGVKALMEENREQMKRIVSLPKGPKGDKGDSVKGPRGPAGKDGVDGVDGKTPIKGVDYWTKGDVESLTVSILARVRQPKDGENALVDEEAIAKKTVEYIKEHGLIGTDHIKGLKDEISSYRHQMAMRQAGQSGGGMTLTAGNGITLTPQTDGTTLISATGGGTGTVTGVLVASANGFAGTSDGDPATPRLTLTTTVTGLLKGNGAAISAAVANTDYQVPITLTTTGSSGPATFDGTTLNIPQYSGGSVSTLAAVSAASDDTAKSLYTMTTNVDVEFEDDGGNTVLYLDESTRYIGIGRSPSYILDVADDIRIIDTLMGQGILTGASTVFDTQFRQDGGYRIGALDGSTFDSAMFQAYGGTHPSFPGRMYFDYGSRARNLTGAIATWRYMDTSGYTDVMTLVASGNVGIGTTSPSVRLHAETNDAATNTVTTVARLTHSSSGTPANGIGTAISFETETAAGNNEIGTVLSSVTTDVTATSEDFDFVVSNMAGGAAAAEKFRVTSTGAAVFNNAFTFPTADGTASQVLQTDGSGNVTWETLAGSDNITIGTTTITSGTNTRILYNNAGVVGEYTLTGSGTVVAMQTAPTFSTNITTPAVLATANDSGALGASGTAFSDLFLASGGVINWAAGDITITHSTNDLVFAGSSGAGNGYFFDNSVSPTANDGASLGKTATSWSDLFLASGGVIGFANGDLTITHATGILTNAISNASTTPQWSLTQASTGDASMRFAVGATRSYAVGIDNSSSDSYKISTAASGSAVLGTGDLFTMTTAGAVTLASSLTATAVLPTANDSGALGSASVSFADLFLASGAVIGFANSNVVLTHSSGILTMGTGDLRVTTAGTNTASVVTVGGTQTLTAKTLTSPAITTATLSGANVLAEGASIQLDPALSADGTYTGTTITGTAGATLAFGDIVYLAAADSRWELADASAASTSGSVLVGICVLAAASDGSATTILLSGNIRADTAFPSLTVSAPVYISETAGDVTNTAPTTTDSVTRVLGFGLTADSMIFNPSEDYVTHV